MVIKNSWLRKGLMVFAVLAVVTIGLSYYMLHRMIGRYTVTAPVLLKMQEAGRQFFIANNAETICFKSSDGIDLVGKLITRHNAKGTVLFCHGFRRNKEQMARFAPLFKKYNQFFFDFRASGDSAGDYSSIGGHEYHDVIAAAQVLRQRGVTRPLIVFGVSMGGAVAIKAIRQQPGLADVLILDSAYASLQDVMSDVFGLMTGLPYYPFLPIMTTMYQWFFGKEALAMIPEEEIAQVKKPLFLIHSATDSFTGAHHSVRLYGKVGAHNKKARLWVGPPAKHGHLFDTHQPYYQYKIKKFLRKARSWLREALSRDVVWQP